MGIQGTTGSILNDGNQLPSITFGAQLAKPESPQRTQPSNVNYLYQTNFRFTIQRLPVMEYFITRATLPGFGPQSNLEQPTRFVAAKHPNNKLVYENLTLTFLINEDMSNWQEVYEWMRTIYLNKDHNRFEDDISSHFTDGSLHILNSAMNPKREIRFRNLLPISLTGIDFQSDVDSLTPFTADVTFAYDYYEFVYDC